MTDDTRIQSLTPLIAPAVLMEELPLSAKAAQLIFKTRATAEAIIKRKDSRLLVIVGPCSIHDVDAALAYASKLKTAIDRYSEDLCIIMRVYFEKPRTTVGWKGLIHDPELDQSFKVNQGLRLARKLLVDLANLGVPSGTEFLDTIVPQFMSDAISWGAIGARTTESQIHRELASGLSMPVGFKNGTDGNIQIAIDAIYSAQHPHHFLSVTKQGISAIVRTKGNEACHLILRGGKTPNYTKTHVDAAYQKLVATSLNPGIMIDCSHGNSQKDAAKQKVVMEDILAQLEKGSEAIAGVMLESHLQSGHQALADKKNLVYGQSITDACIDWAETESLLEALAQVVSKRKQV